MKNHNSIFFDFLLYNISKLLFRWPSRPYLRTDIILRSLVAFCRERLHRWISGDMVLFVTELSVHGVDVQRDCYVRFYSCPYTHLVLPRPWVHEMPWHGSAAWVDCGIAAKWWRNQILGPFAFSKWMKICYSPKAGKGHWCQAVVKPARGFEMKVAMWTRCRNQNFKILRIIVACIWREDLPTRATFLGAHAHPRPRSRRKIIKDHLHWDYRRNASPRHGQRKSLRITVDVALWKGFFSPSRREADRLFVAARLHRLKAGFPLPRNQVCIGTAAALSSRQRPSSGRIRMNHLEELERRRKSH